MRECICRAAEGCRDYPIDLGCLFLGAAANGINPRLGQPVSLEEALAHLERCRDAGLVHLIGRNKIDTIWLGVTPGERLLTICQCCPCCCLWRILPQLPHAIGRKVSRMPGVEVRVSDRCTGCGTCLDACFVSAIQLEDGRSHISELCVGCGRCVSVCPDEAICLRVSGQPVETCADQLSRLVDVT
jgi:ferredoxin